MTANTNPIAAALAELDTVKVADTSFLTACAHNYGPDSTPAANLAELRALRKLASAVREYVSNEEQRS